MCLKAERDTVLVPEINMDLGFKYGVQLSQHLCSSVVLIPPLAYQSSFCLAEGKCLKKELFGILLHPLCINSFSHTGAITIFQFFFLSFCHLMAPSLTSLCLFPYMRKKKEL